MKALAGLWTIGAEESCFIVADLTLGVSAGSLTESGALGFWSAKQISTTRVEDWRVLSRQHVEFEAVGPPVREFRAEWSPVVEKVA